MIDQHVCVCACLLFLFSFLWVPCFAVCWVLRIGPTPREKYTSRMTCVLIPIAFLHFSAGAGLVFAFFPEKKMQLLVRTYFLASFLQLMVGLVCLGCFLLAS